MALPVPRIHFYEIDDQSWFPSFLREKVQAALTLLWTKRFPPFQSCSPASLVVRTLQSLLGSSIKDYTFIDFCSGAGGPTPEFERQINKALELESIEKYHAKQKSLATTGRRRRDVNPLGNGLPTSASDDDDDDPSTSSRTSPAGNSPAPNLRTSTTSRNP
ncbi:MAG: hypothetical protein L6R39_004244 [Caloplaca ligustica]|nr:MAG: hypothetical protein L6R39_004244 [Caloplaca ligustica]